MLRLKMRILRIEESFNKSNYSSGKTEGF